uniref:Apple domain-containing protein n=1 Tax=Syphacia muris TaxID=451379 RepID=A0A0N5ARK7_9BILA
MVGITVTITCERTSSVQTFSLSKTDLFTARSFQVRTINEFHIRQSSSATIAKVSAKSCKNICWEQTLVAEKYDHQFISYHENKNCELLSTINSSSAIRTYQIYQISNGTLTILTKYQKAKEEDEEVEKGQVQINATMIGDPELLLSNDNDSLIANISSERSVYLKFNTNESVDGKFIISDLQPGQWYSVIYHYTLLSPFRFHEQKRFIVYVDAAANPENSAAIPENAPIKMMFNSTTYFDHNGRPSESKMPYVKIEQNSGYKAYPILATFPSMCENTNNSSSNNVTEIWLDNSNPTVQLNLDLPQILCKRSMKYKFCDSNKQQEYLSTNCDHRICFDAFLLIDGERYEMQEYCEDVLQHFPEPSDSSGILALNSGVNACYWISEALLLPLLGLLMLPI